MIIVFSFLETVFRKTSSKFVDILEAAIVRAVVFNYSDRVSGILFTINDINAMGKTLEIAFYFTILTESIFDPIFR